MPFVGFVTQGSSYLSCNLYVEMFKKSSSCRIRCWRLKKLKSKNINSAFKYNSAIVCSPKVCKKSSRVLRNLVTSRDSLSRDTSRSTSCDARHLLSKDNARLSDEAHDRTHHELVVTCVLVRRYDHVEARGVDISFPVERPSPHPGVFTCEWQQKLLIFPPFCLEAKHC